MNRVCDPQARNSTSRARRYSCRRGDSRCTLLRRASAMTLGAWTIRGKRRDDLLLPKDRSRVTSFVNKKKEKKRIFGEELSETILAFGALPLRRSGFPA